MKLIIISNPTNLNKEHATVCSLFEAGLEYFHLRKPDFTYKQLEEYIQQIPQQYRNKIVIHSHHQLAVEYGLKGVHYTKQTPYQNMEVADSIHESISIHSLEELKNINANFDYVFLSPVFDSISKKAYKPTLNLLEIKSYLQTKKVLPFGEDLGGATIALGGIDEQTVPKAIELGFDGVAVLGALWMSGNPIKKFKNLVQLCNTPVRVSNPDRGNNSRNIRPNVLTIAGFDPSAGAGILADIKTFEQCNVYGMGVVSALTYQNDISFEKVQWISLSQIVEQINVLQKRFQFEYIKIGLIENLEILNQLISKLKTKDSRLKIIWDPILKASAGFEFHNSINRNLLDEICKQLYLITPNIPEVLQLGAYNNAEKNAKHLSQFCNVYLKGGHSEENKGTDFLYTTTGKEIKFEASALNIFPKHGSGCVLSSAITAGLAKDLSLQVACTGAKKYITDFLSSNESLLGYPSKITIEHE